MTMKKLTNSEDSVSLTLGVGLSSTEISEFLENYVGSIDTAEPIYARTRHDSYHFVISTIAVNTTGQVILTLTEVKE